jgi:hypothetical protein
VTTVSADGVFMLGGITKSFNEHTSIDSPWDRDKISETSALAERVSGVNRDFGAWIKALELEGTYLEKIGYSPSLYLNAIITRERIRSSPTPTKPARNISRACSPLHGQSQYRLRRVVPHLPEDNSTSNCSRRSLRVPNLHSSEWKT